MSVRRRLPVAAALSVLTLACAATPPVPSGWLPSAQRAQADPYGAWIQVSRPRSEFLTGEFLAADRDSVYVLSPDGSVISAPLDSATRARIVSYDSNSASLAAWAMIGSVSTISNGFFLVLTLPTWIIGGVVATNSQARRPVFTPRGASEWEHARRYARFPGGLPANLPRTLPVKARRRQ